MLSLSLVLAAMTGCAHTNASAPPALQKYEFVQPKMGTVFRIVLYAPDRETGEKAAAAAFARVDQLNQELSDYDPNSELSLLCQKTNDGPMKEPAPVGQDLFDVLDVSLKAAELSEGAFDPTVGPFTRLWRRSRELKELPTPERVEAARGSFGHRYVKLDKLHRSVQLLAPRMRLDLGGIAKGYTADQVMIELRKLGIKQAVVGAAGDLAIGDPPPGRDNWKIGIQSLQKPNELAGYVFVHNVGISTSGDTYRFVEIDGQRYSHIVDPRTGLGLTHRIGVTAIAPDATTSDWVETAVPVMGAEKGLKLVEQLKDCAVRIVSLEGETSTIAESSAFKSAGFEPAAPAATSPSPSGLLQ
jgi:thiamine biosynthesis lipoprotein